MRSVHGAVVLALTLGTWACEVVPCAGLEPTGSPTTPEVTNLELLSQLRGDPWTLIFKTEFIDNDGNLGKGTGEFYLNANREPTMLKLQDVFIQSGVSLVAPAGQIAVPLRFAETVSDGANVVLGLQVLDEAEERSNCFSLDLEFSVQPVGN